MMNKVQYYLNKINQECSEVIKDSTKAMCFGVHSKDPSSEYADDNITNVVHEVYDVIAAFETLMDLLGLPYKIDSKEAREYINSKKERNENYFKLSVGFKLAKDDFPVTCKHCTQIVSGKRDDCMYCGAPLRGGGGSDCP